MTTRHQNMKKVTKRLVSTLLLILGPVILSFSQEPPHPGYNSGSWSPVGHGSTLGCPVGNGHLLLLALAVAYGAYQYWQIMKSKKAI